MICRGAAAGAGSQYGRDVPMTAAAALAKAGAMLLTNEDARKRVGWVLVAALSPVILLLVFIFSLASGTAAHNVSAVQLCFQRGALPDARLRAGERDVLRRRHERHLHAASGGRRRGDGERRAMRQGGGGRGHGLLRRGRRGADDRETRTVTTKDEMGNDVEEEETYHFYRKCLVRKRECSRMVSVTLPFDYNTWLSIFP